MFALDSITVPRYLWVALLCAAAACALAGFVIAYIAGGHVAYYNEFAAAASNESPSMLAQMGAAVIAYPAAFIATGLLLALSVLAAVGSSYSVRVSRALAFRTEQANGCAAIVAAETRGVWAVAA